MSSASANKTLKPDCRGVPREDRMPPRGSRLANRSAALNAAWLVFVAVAAGCATTSREETAGNAAISAYKAGVPSCESGHADSFTDGVVAIRPGETICLAFQEDASGITLTGVVESTSDVGAIMVLKAWSEGSDVFLTVQNPFSKDIKYRAGMRLPGEERARKTSSCPVRSGIMTLEHWPHPIDEILLTDFHFDTKRICE